VYWCGISLSIAKRHKSQTEYIVSIALQEQHAGFFAVLVQAQKSAVHRKLLSRVWGAVVLPSTF
jgi:hypothetical protein